MLSLLPPFPFKMLTGCFHLNYFLIRELVIPQARLDVLL